MDFLSWNYFISPITVQWGLGSKITCLWRFHERGDLQQTWSHHLSWPFLCGCYLVGFSFCSLPPFYLTRRNLFGLPVFSRALMSWLLTDILLPQSSQNSSLHPHPSFHVPALVCDLWSLSTNLNYWHFWAFEWCLAGFFWCVWQWWHYWQQQGPVHTHPLKKKRFSFKTVVTKKKSIRRAFSAVNWSREVSPHCIEGIQWCRWVVMWKVAVNPQCMDGQESLTWNTGVITKA